MLLDIWTSFWCWRFTHELSSKALIDWYLHGPGFHILESKGLLTWRDDHAVHCRLSDSQDNLWSTTPPHCCFLIGQFTMTLLFGQKVSCFLHCFELCKPLLCNFEKHTAYVCSLLRSVVQSIQREHKCWVTVVSCFSFIIDGSAAALACCLIRHMSMYCSRTENFGHAVVILLYPVAYEEHPFVPR